MDGDAVKFDRVPRLYWSERLKISHMQRRVIVYSIMYYELDESCVSDEKYGSIVKQLLEMQKSAKREVLEKTAYYYAMYDFDGSTGFHLYKRLKKKDREHLLELAKEILYVYKKERSTNG